jgi:hypothetical protein
VIRKVTEHESRNAGARLQRLRELYVPETIEEGRLRLEADERLAAEQRARTESVDVAAARRLEELRALLELTRVLHAARKL